jgi:hypothetical protein
MLPYDTTLQDILDKPTSIDNVHESCYRCYSVLGRVEEMAARGISPSEIHSFIQDIHSLNSNGEFLHRERQ